MDVRKSPYGALIPPYFNHQPAGVVGNRAYLKALRRAIEEALEEGLGAEEVFMPDGEGHYLVVKLEEDVDKIPNCYAHFFPARQKSEFGEDLLVADYLFSEKEWSIARDLVAGLEDFYLAWNRVHSNLWEFLSYLFFHKCQERKKDRGWNGTCYRLYQHFFKLSQDLLFDRDGYRKLPTLEEWERFFSRLWRLNVPDFCLRTIIRGTEREVRACVDFSLLLVRKGVPNKTMEGVGIVNNNGSEYFLFLVKDGRELSIPPEKGWIWEGKKLFIPAKGLKGFAQGR